MKKPGWRGGPRPKVTDARIARLFAEGRTVTQISKAIKRSYMGSLLRLRKLKLKK